MVERAPLVEPYELAEMLGQGGMGVVHRAVHRPTGTVVALKMVRRLDPELLESVRREIQALSKLQHPGVVRIVHTGTEALSPWFAMEFLERRTLATIKNNMWADWYAENSEMPTLEHATRPAAPATLGRFSNRSTRPAAAAGKLSEAVDLIRQLADTLAYVHGQGLVHRDIKPDNVFVRPQGIPVLVDFGLAAHFGGILGRERLEDPKLGAGTAEFMAPEVILAEPADARADLYALGCIFYELVTGVLPFVAPDTNQVLKMQLKQRPTPPSELVDGLPMAIEALILGLLAKRPEDRIGHASDVVDMLTAFEASNAPPGSSAPPGAGVPRSRSYLYRPRVVGRDDVLRLLSDRVQKTCEGQGGVVLIAGESGVGKTFLAGELGRRAIRLGLRVVTGECNPVGTADPSQPDEPNVPLHPFRGLFHAVADRCAKEGVETTRRLLGDRCRILAHYHRALAQLPGADGNPAPETLPSDGARSRTIEAVAATLVALAADTPLVLVLDDLQWADALSLDVIRYLTPTFFSGQRLLIVATYRGDEISADLAKALEGTKAHRVVLECLDSTAVGQQVANMLAVPTPPLILGQFLFKESEGNPFFVAEYLRAAIEERLIFRRHGRWVVSATGESLDALSGALALPGSLRELVSRRLSTLSEPARELVIAAAVLGRDVDARMLAGLVDQAPDEMIEALSELLRRQVLEQPAPGRYRFVHDKVREIVYEQTDLDQRRQFHLRAGRLIEERGDDAHEYPVLAQHFRLAGDPEKAVRYYRAAGREAWAVGAFSDAREHLNRALELSPVREPGRTALDARLAEAQTRHWLGESLFRLGDIDAAIVKYGDALIWLGYRPLPKTRPGWGLLLLRQALRQLAFRWLPDRVYRVGDEKRRLLVAEAAAIAERLSWAYVFRFRMTEMLASIFLGVNLSDRASAPGRQGATHASLGSLLGHLGMHKIAARYFERARRSALQSGEVTPLLREAQSECVFYLNQGQWNALWALGQPAFEKGRAAGTTHETESLSQALSTASMLTGDFPEAERRARELAQTAAQLGHQLQAWWGTLTLAACAFRQGRFGEVNDLLLPVEKGCRERNDVVSRLECLALMAVAALRGGDRDRALHLASEARAVALERGSGSVFGYCFHWLLPEVYAAEAARPHADIADRRFFLERFHEGLRSAEKFARMCRVARPFALIQRGRAHQIARAPAKAAAAFRESARIAGEIGMPFDEALALLELSLLKDVDETERNAREGQARSIFLRLGCAWHLQHTDQIGRGAAA
jgi:serine/threonine protein kinase/tetratricopeptide (TPR) repeat protein